MVVVQMREERAGHVHGATPALEESMMRARTMVEHEQFAADFDQVAAALSLERRCRRAGAEQNQAHD